MTVEGSNPYEVTSATTGVIRFAPDAADFEIIGTVNRRNQWVVRGYDDRIQYCQDEVTYELMRDSPDFWTRCVAEQPLGLKFQPAELEVLRKWVGPPRQADLVKKINGLWIRQFGAAAFFAGEAWAAFDRLASFVAGMLLVWNLLEFVLGRLMPRPSLFLFSSAAWFVCGTEGLRQWIFQVRSDSVAAFLSASAILLVFSLKNYLTYRNVIPDDQLREV